MRSYFCISVFWNMLIPIYICNVTNTIIMTHLLPFFIILTAIKSESMKYYTTIIKYRINNRHSIMLNFVLVSKIASKTVLPKLKIKISQTKKVGTHSLLQFSTISIWSQCRQWTHRFFKVKLNFIILLLIKFFNDLLLLEW